MVVQLTQADIDNGVPGDCLRDPVANALRRLTGVPWRVEQQYCYPDTIERRPYPTPRIVNKFVEAFDNGQPVKPISFELR